MLVQLILEHKHKLQHISPDKLEGSLMGQYYYRISVISGNYLSQSQSSIFLLIIFVL